MILKPHYSELHDRITSHMAIAKNEQEVRDISIAWSGYIVALHEWGSISTRTMDRLADLIPIIENDPVVTVAVGVPDEDDEE